MITSWDELLPSRVLYLICGRQSISLNTTNSARSLSAACAARRVDGEVLNKRCTVLSAAVRHSRTRVMSDGTRGAQRYAFVAVLRRLLPVVCCGKPERYLIEMRIVQRRRGGERLLMRGGTEWPAVRLRAWIPQAADES